MSIKLDCSPSLLKHEMILQLFSANPFLLIFNKNRGRRLIVKLTINVAKQFLGLRTGFIYVSRPGEVRG